VRDPDRRLSRSGAHRLQGDGVVIIPKVDAEDVFLDGFVA
jgi:hypothetical protein